MSIKKSLINITNNPNKSFIQASFIDSEKVKTENFGSLFILTEINYPSRIAEKIVFIITQLLEKNYFLNEKIILSDQLNSLKIESIFESALVKTNRELLEFIDQEKINFNFKDLNIIVGLIYDDQIHFSSMGQNKSFLIRKTDKGCQISDINPDSEDHEIEDLASGKIFSSIISGELPNNSYTVFTNASLSQYLLNEDSVKILEELKLEGATEQIKNLLKKINNYSNFSGIIIKNFNNELEKEEFKYSESNLSLTEKNTEKLLNSPGSINKENFNKNFNNFLNKINIFKYLIKPFKAIKKIKIKKEKNNTDLPVINEKKSRTKKILLILLGVLLLLLATRLYFQKDKDQKIFEEEASSTFEEQIIQKQNQIDSSLLYNNETKAKEIIEELRNLMNSLSDKDKNKIKNYSDLETKLKEQINQIQKMITISEPKELANFSIINGNANTKSIILSQKNNKIYSIDPENKSIYILNLKDNIIGKLLENDLIQGENPISADDVNNNSYFLAQDQIITISPEEKISFTKINIENRDVIKSFDFYNNRPYLVNSEKNQIIRYSKNNNEFSSPTEWLKDNSNINPIGLAIDFSIYILNQDGQIFKYLEGKKEAFQTDAVDPILEKSEIIRLSDNYIFVIDKGQKRLIIYTREKGTFINQYSSDKFDDLKDLAVDEKQKKAYILNGNIIYEINLIL
ncbi:MAG TPA: hypothetical protein PK142_00510 [bacterium]|nr:hypothetical protein [bacterium]